MILRSLHVDGFGVHRDLDLAGFEAGLTVVYGENEAGKTTLLHFLRAMLYGFDEHKRHQERYENDGAHGGSVTLEIEPGHFPVAPGSQGSQWKPGERVRFSRHFRSGRKAFGDLKAEDANGPIPDAEAALKRALGNSSRALFENIFAIGLDDLRKLHAEGLREHIYGAGMTGKGASLPLALADLRKRSRELLPAGAKGGRIGRILGEMDEFHRKIDELSRRPEAHRQVVARIGELTALLAGLDADLPRHKLARDRKQRLARASEPWAELAGLPALGATAPRFPPGGEERLEVALLALDRVKTGQERARLRREEIAHRLETASFNAVLIERAPEIDAFHAESDRRLGNDAPGLARARAAELATIAAQKLAALGSEWDAARVASFDASAESERELLAAADRATSAENTAREARRDADHATESEVRDREEIARLLTEVERIGDAEDKANKLERRVTEFEKTLDEAKAAEILWKDIERRSGQAGSLPDAQAILDGTRRANRILYVLSGVSMVAGFILVVAKGGEVYAGVALLVVAFALVAFAVYRHPVAIPFSGPSGREKEEARARVENARRGKRDRSLITFQQPEAGEEEAHRARSEIGDLRAQAKRKSEAERTIGEKKVDLGRAARTALEKRRIADEATAAWHSSTALLKAWLAAHGLAPSLAPESARTTLLAVREVQDNDRAQEDAEAEVERLEKAAAEFAERAGALLEAFGRPRPLPRGTGLALLAEETRPLPRGTGLALLAEETRPLSTAATEVHSSLTVLRNDSLAARAAKEGKIRDQAELPRADKELADAAGEVLAAEAARRKLFAEADATDLDGFFAAAEAHAAWNAAREKRDHLEGRLRAALGDEDDEIAREILKDTPREELLRDAAELEGAVKRLEAEREAALVERTRADAERERLENEDELAALRVAEEAAREDLAVAAGAWQQLIAAEWLLERARRQFEADHQPRILRAAGRFLETITRGRWVAVRAVPEATTEEDRLRLVRFDEPDRLHSIASLSRGTMEQLYLALRLALASEFPDPGVKLPLILDDVLVNFSGSRRAAAAEAIASISSRVQVIAFTCHAEMRDALMATTRTARRMDLPEPPRPDEASRKAAAGKPGSDRQLRLPGA